MPERYEEAPDYKKFRNEKFDKAENKIRRLIADIEECSLKNSDKVKILARIHTMAEHAYRLKKQITT